MPQQLPISGNEYLSQEKNLTELDQGKVYAEFIKYYESEAAKKGWNQTLTYKNAKLSVINADNITGNTWGYIKAINDNIEILVISRYIQFDGNLNNEPPKCPCNTEYRIFQSNPIQISEIKKR